MTVSFFALLSEEGLAVRALIHGGVGLVGADQNLVQRAVVGLVTVVTALADGAGDALVDVFAVHIVASFPVLHE